MRSTTVLPMAVVLVVVLLLHAARRAAGAGGGDGSYDRSCGSMNLAYPFGFSSGCTIRLVCDANITCSAPFKMPPTSRVRFRNSFEKGPDSSLVRDKGQIWQKILYYMDEPVPAEELSALELDWWVLARCRCSPRSDCVHFISPTTEQEAFRCECMEGFEGDGFINGARCQQPVRVASSSMSHKLPLLAGVSGAFLLSLGISALFLIRRRKRRNTMKKKTKQLPGKAATLFRGKLVEDKLEQGATGPQRFSYDELAAATNNFCDNRALGRGGFGSVYRGFLSNMNREVAIKRVAETSRQGWKEFVSEVNIISRLRNRNLVQLIGWCHGGDELLLIYELMHNGSLDTHMYSPDSVLAWPIRYEIVLGIGSALLYLHQDTEQSVVHRDIKPSNIMLDVDFTAKLGDFGLARLINDGRRSHTTGMAGTLGYIDPESALASRASVESDVYSFGVLLLEVAC